eukprot:m.2790 g.2790  ORF g.2790 m.2790 type:complete len:232 (+) comp4092_c0_seq1:25-720(+)
MFDSRCVVQIESAQRKGSGVEIGDGLVLTCAHVVGRGRRCTVVQEHRRIQALIVYQHQELDIAVLQLSSHHRAFPSVLAQAIYPAAHPTFSLAIAHGFPQRSDLVRKQLTTTSGTLQATAASNRVLIRATCPVYKGMSGGALTLDGQLLGIITSYAEECSQGKCHPRHDCSFAVPVKFLASWLPVLVDNAKMASPQPWHNLMPRIDAAVETAITAEAARDVWKKFPIVSKL